MRLNGRKCAANICLLVPVIFFATIASAQLSSSVGGSLSDPLDINIYGPDSSVAPTTSSTIEPGANSLLTPDEHVLPYDAIGASIIATPLSPAVTQSYAVSRVPFQVDNALRDASIITGLHTAQPSNVVDIIARKAGKQGASSLPQSSWSTGGTSSLSSIASLRGKSTLGLNGSSITQQSSWKAGGASAALIINPPDQVLQTGQQPGNALKDTNGPNLQNKNQNDQSEHNSGPQPEKARDYSRSPLEKLAADDQDPIIDTSASPFGSLDKKSFLDPDITSISSPHKAPTGGAATSFTGRTQSGSLMQKSSGLLDRGAKPRTRDRGISNTMSRSTKLSPDTGHAEKPKWHNPILQQMEAEANSVRQ